MAQPKKLIEVAMPVKEVSAESVRDKSIRHGHISTLHLWWARRPLPVCRAVVFASLVFDPEDENCPEQFKEAVRTLLSGDRYKPYEDMPFTAAIDPMEDNLRTRLLVFIAKFSDKFLKIEKSGQGKCNTKETISDHSLIKWDNKNNEEIISIARKLIWVAHDPVKNSLSEFEKQYSAIKLAENKLYLLIDRHLKNDEVVKLETDLNKAIEAFLDRMPKVFDPFAGGGAIPLEAARLGCRSYANDLNPVAHIIERASIEFPQKYGKPINYSKSEFTRIYGADKFNELFNINGYSIGLEEDKITIKNRLAFDVEFYAQKLILEAEKEIGNLYPKDNEGRTPIAYFWARVGTCSNPSCVAKVPLLSRFSLADTHSKKIYLNPIISETKIDFEIKNGKCNKEGWINRGNLKCPCCGNITSANKLKEQFRANEISFRMLAVIYSSGNGKEYNLPNEQDIAIFQNIPEVEDSPQEPMPVTYTQALPSCTWGLSRWGEMFTNRQLLAINTLKEKLINFKSQYFEDNEYHKTIITYLAILIDRLSSRLTSFGYWDVTRETLTQPFGRQAIPMVFDFIESNLFCSSTGSASNQIEWIVRYIESEASNPFYTICLNSNSGEKNQFPVNFFDSVITDPPYYDAIAYADLSDFFYVWLKRNLGDIFPEVFAYYLTPKSDECTALKHHHENNKNLANKHFENKLYEIFNAINDQTKKEGIISIMFAHQSTEAWTTLCNSILNANMNITGSWAIDSEMQGALKTDKAFLQSSVTVSCRPRETQGIGSFSDVKREINKAVKKKVNELWILGFRGADLLTACFGSAVSVVGKYEKVEKASGELVTVKELLELTRESAFNAIVSDISTDDYTRFYIGWLNLFGFTEAGHDDVNKISQIGLHIDLNEVMNLHILQREGNKESLCDWNTRIAKNNDIGKSNYSIMVDKIHRAMQLFEGERKLLLDYIARVASNSDNEFWRVLTALVEVLPKGIEDYRLSNGLLTSKDNILRESRQYQPAIQESLAF